MISTIILNNRLEESNYYSTSVVNVSYHGLMPVMSLLFATNIHRDIEIAVPLLCEKTLQWFFDWQTGTTISTLFLKLGTGGRINRCRLELSVWQ